MTSMKDIFIASACGLAAGVLVGLEIFQPWQPHKPAPEPQVITQDAHGVFQPMPLKATTPLP